MAVLLLSRLPNVLVPGAFAYTSQRAPGSDRAMLAAPLPELLLKLPFAARVTAVPAPLALRMAPLFSVTSAPMPR